VGHVADDPDARAVERPEYGAQMAEQVTAAQEKRGLGDLGALLRRGPLTES